LRTRVQFPPSPLVRPGPTIRGAPAKSRSFGAASQQDRHRFRALVELGAALRRANRRADARPRRPALTGPDALTPREHRVATLAAAGHSNRDIAQELFVSRRTVETHLTHAFQKLDISNREQLATRLTHAVPS
jgi:DNA-binding NarL/FixJ family response regulator